MKYISFIFVDYTFFSAAITLPSAFPPAPIIFSYILILFPQESKSTCTIIHFHITGLWQLDFAVMIALNSTQ